ncbi:hypothetical protein JOD67_006707 [Tenggerimyces flavus]|nr:hypothetical protein [Tenggerimyces flavus]
MDASDGDGAERIRDLAGGRGADVAIEVSGNARALHEAVRSVAYSSRVIAARLVPGDAVGLRRGEEFHLNRVPVVSSQISGVAPALPHRWDRYRFNTPVLGLAIAGRIQLRGWCRTSGRSPRRRRGSSSSTRPRRRFCKWS